MKRSIYFKLIFTSDAEDKRFFESLRSKYQVWSTKTAWMTTSEVAAVLMRTYAEAKYGYMELFVNYFPKSFASSGEVV